MTTVYCKHQLEYLNCNLNMQAGLNILDARVFGLDLLSIQAYKLYGI